MIEPQSYSQFLNEIPKHCKLVAVSKRQSNNAVLELYNMGQRIFGENQVQELIAKKVELPEDIEWHFIGTLQKNKVNKLVGIVHLIHSVDNLALATKINSRAESLQIEQEVLLQLNISGEESKSGFSESKIIEVFSQINDLKNLRIKGLMTIGDNVDNSEQIKQTFRKCKQILEALNKQYKLQLTELSMGMSGDFKIAIEEGSTLIRVGSLLFGDRK